MADHWSQWLRAGRFTEDRQVDGTWERLHRWRDGILDHADLEGHERLLDLGTGEGLIGFGALDRLGPGGEVIFSDVSRPLLEQCRRQAMTLDGSARTECLHSPAQQIPFGDDTIDVVTARSVLVYIHEKERTLAECHRILSPGGRISLFEPVNSFHTVMAERDHLCWGYEVSDCPVLAEKVNAAWRGLYAPASENVATDFHERELFSLLETAGFEDVHLELSAWNTFTESGRAEEWESFLDNAPNPYAPTLREAMKAGLTAGERDRLTAELKPLVESQTAPKADRGAGAFIWGTKR